MISQFTRLAMIRKLPLLLTGIILALAINSCSSDKIVATFDNLRNLKKGMSSSDVEKVFKMEVLHDYSFIYNGTTYRAKHYQLVLKYSTSGVSSRWTGPGRNDSRASIDWEAVVIPCILLFHDDRLMYWGMQGEYSKSEDDNIRAMWPTIAENWDKNKKE